MKKGYKLCPFCKEEIKEEAVKCRYWGEFLDEKKEEKVKKEKIINGNSKKKISVGEIIAAVICLIIFGLGISTYFTDRINCNKLNKEKYELITNHTAYYQGLITAGYENGAQLPDEIRQKLFDNINNNTKKFISNYSNTFHGYNPTVAGGGDAPSICSSKEVQNIKSYDNMYFSFKKCLEKNNTIENLLDCNTSLLEAAVNKVTIDAGF